MMTPTAVAPVPVARVVAVAVVATVVIRLPPAPAVGTANPTHLFDFRSGVCSDRCDRHCRCGGRGKAATKRSGRKNELYFAHGLSSVDAPLTHDPARSFGPDLVE